MSGLRGFVLMATILVACNAPTEPERSVVDPSGAARTDDTSKSEERAGASTAASVSQDAVKLAPEVRYLIDPESGEIVMDVPPAILADVREQLAAAGHGDEAENLARLYDLEKGRVRDESRAKAAASVVRAARLGGAQ